VHHKLSVFLFAYVTEHSSKHPLPYYYHYTNNLKYIRGNQIKKACFIDMNLPQITDSINLHQEIE
jgi:hypothetical protein